MRFNRMWLNYIMFHVKGICRFIGRIKAKFSVWFIKIRNHSSKNFFVHLRNDFS